MASHPAIMPSGSNSAVQANLSPESDIRHVQSTFLSHYLELLNDQNVMQQLPAGFRLEMQTAPESSRFSITERVARDYIGGPEPLRRALHEFEARHHLTVAAVPQTSSEISLFDDDDMPPVDPRFVGRQEPLQRIANALLAPEPKSVVIRGVAGMGKSTLARKAVADPRIEDAYNIAWIPCEGIMTVPDLERLVAHVHLTGAGSSATQASLYQPKRLLIVLNRIDQLVAAYGRRDAPLLNILRRLEQKRVASLLPRLLITLASQHDLGLESVDIDLDSLGDDEAAAFFTTFKCTQRWRDSPHLWYFLHRFAGHPLALSVAARAAPRDGDLDTYVAMLQQHQQADDDDFDVVIRMLLLDSSIQAPKTRQLLRLIAYWPPFECGISTIQAILGLHSMEAVITVADPASQLGLLRLSRDGVRWKPAYLIAGPFKDRLLRIDPPLDEELAVIRSFVFNQVYDCSDWPRWSPEIFPPWNLDPIFLDALRSPEPDVIKQALDAILVIPRYCTYGFTTASFVYGPGYSHALRLDTLETALAAADRIDDSKRRLLLQVLIAETRIQSFDPASRAKASLVSDVHSDLEDAFDTLCAQDDNGPALRKCCYVLAWCIMVEADSTTDEHRLSHLRRAQHYLNLALFQRVPSPSRSQGVSRFPYLPAEFTLDRVQIGLLRFHLFVQVHDLDKAHEEYLGILVALDQSLACGSYDMPEVEFRVRAHVAAVFAARGSLERAGTMVDLDMRALPKKPESSRGVLCIFVMTLFRFYLGDHKDARRWLKWYFDDNYLRFWRWWANRNLYLIAEIALLSLELTADTSALYVAWLSALAWWSSHDNASFPRLPYGCCAEGRFEFGVSEVFDQLPLFKNYLPVPDDGYATSYHRSYAALLALCESNFADAASEFLTLQTIYLDDLPLFPGYKDEDSSDYSYHFVSFPPEAFRSVWKSVFAALTQDCLERQSSERGLIPDASTSA